MPVRPSIHNIQRIHANLFIRPSQFSGPTARWAPIVSSTIRSLSSGFLTLTSSASVNTLNVFSMEHRIDVLASDSLPFDSYAVETLAFVVEKATNKSVPIITFAAGEGPNGFIVWSTEESVTSTFTYDSGTGAPTTVEVPSRIALISITRSRLVRAFTMCLLLVDSGLAVGSTYVMLLVFFRREGLDSTVLLLPVTIVLTIPTLRSLYPDSPPFGIYIGEPQVLGS